MPDLVLASTSAYRRSLLARLGLPFGSEAPGVDEDAVKQRASSPAFAVDELARQKALAVARRHPTSLVIGGDQAATIDGAILDKPGTEANAHAQLRRLAGREHELLTAVAIARGDTVLAAWTDRTVLTMRELTDDEIVRYVRAERPLDCAGSYKVEGLGIALFTRIDGGDHTAIVGLPLLRLAAELRRLGVRVP
jgi:septum formation protein